MTKYRFYSKYKATPTKLTDFCQDESVLEMMCYPQCDESNDSLKCICVFNNNAFESPRSDVKWLGSPSDHLSPSESQHSMSACSSKCALKCKSLLMLKESSTTLPYPQSSDSATTVNVKTGDIRKFIEGFAKTTPEPKSWLDSEGFSITAGKGFSETQCQEILVMSAFAGEVISTPNTRI